MSAPGTLEQVGRHLTLLLRPLGDAVRDTESFRGLMYRLGWNATAMPAEYQNLGTLIDAALQTLEDLTEEPTAAEVLELVARAKAVFDAIQSISSAPPGVDAGAFLAEIGERLFELLLTDYLAAELPVAYDLLSMLHVIEPEVVLGEGPRPTFMRVHFRWAELPKIISDPLSLPQRVYGWGTPELNTDLIIDHLAELLFALRFPIALRETPEPLRQGYGGTLSPLLPPTKSLVVPFYYITIAGQNLEAAFVLRPLPGTAVALPGLVLEPHIPRQFRLSVHIADDLDLRVRAGTNAADLFGILIRPNDVSIRYPLAPTAPPPAAGVGVGFDFKPAAPTLLLGDRDATRLQLGEASLDLAVNAVADALEMVVGAELRGLALILAARESDSFMRHILGDGETTIEVPLGVEWSSRFGLRFKGSAAFEVALHPHLNIGPIAVNTIVVRLGAPAEPPPDPPPKVTLDVGAGISGDLGPLTFVVEEIGLGVHATFVRGNVGPFDLALGFKPPKGIGLELDGGGFKGGGYLFLDAEKGEYAGTLELDFQGIVAVKGLGILNTKMPDAGTGFSLLIIITAEFTPLQLGFGFTLLGVGGLLGLNRTAMIEVLREGVRDGSLSSVLFPRDVVANAPRLISDLNRIFPPRTDSFLFAPMGKLGWGTPTLLTLELGIILELPRPGFAIVGVLRVSLPAEDVAILHLQVNFLGSVDLDKQQLSFDASLFESRVLSFTLSGDMALRVYWGENANFLLSVGGFHPDYTPPPMGLGPMERLSIVIWSGNPSLRAEGYFAVTSNTVQFGARVELYAGASIFNVYGFLGFNVLIQFNPFHFIAEVSAMLAVRTGRTVLFSVRLQLMLEGPTPWHARGRASFEIGFIFTITISVGFDVTFGERRVTTLPPIEVLPELKRALDHIGNWRVNFPSGTNQQVSLRAVPAAEQTLILHPFGTLEISQKVVPLNLEINRFGTQRPENGRRFGISAVSIGDDVRELDNDTAPDAITMLKEQFAAAQFIDMSDDEKLARRSFERYDAGVRVGGGDRPRTDYMTTVRLMYEVIYVRRPARPIFHRLAKFVFDAFVRTSAIARSPLGVAQRSPSILGTARVVLDGERFGVATMRDLSLHDDTLVFASEAEAREALRTLIDDDAGLRGELQVVPLHEIQHAA